jgi:hypothetical protein
MTHENAVDPGDYVSTVLRLYLEMPETPLKPSANDRQQAAELHERQVSIVTIESALLLASLRRLGRPPHSPRLSPIRSLAYFMPVVEELLAGPLHEGYVDYLRDKLHRLGTDIFKSKQTGARSKKYVSS